MPAAGCGCSALSRYQCFPGKVWVGRACWLESCLGHHVRQIKTVLHLPSQLVLVALCLINGPRTLRRKIILLLSLEPKLGTLVSVLQPCFQSPMSWEHNPPWRGSVLMPCDSWCLCGPSQCRWPASGPSFQELVHVSRTHLRNGIQLLCAWAVPCFWAFGSIFLATAIEACGNISLELVEHLNAWSRGSSKQL